MKFLPRIYLPGIVAGDEHSLSQNETHRLTRVLRLGRGAMLFAFDGEGNEFRARIAAIEGGKATVAIEEALRHEAEPALAITLAASISRATRMEWLLEKSVELGAAAIRPVFTARGKVRLDAARSQHRQEHWQAVVIAAAAQCGRARLPILATPVPLSDLLRDTDAQSRIALLPDAEIPLARLAPPQGEVTLLTGPESGFDTAEEAQIIAAGWRTARLGPLTLRAETAGPAALVAVQTLWGDWR